ncbi:MAG: hypothetical protein MJZ31_08605 [Bacteroidales bacterium]|nr:hypothetical protein [Bacteroidales bacterium]
MLKHLFFVLISVLALCAPVTAYAEEAPTSEDFPFYKDIIATVKIGDNEFFYEDPVPITNAQTITVTYGETTVQNIIDQTTSPDSQKYRRVGPEVDDEVGWYFWPSHRSGWRNRTTVKSSDVITTELFGGDKGLKGVGAVYEYIGKTTIKVVDKDGMEVNTVDLAEEFDIPYTSEYPCWCYEQYKNGQWEISWTNRTSLLRKLCNPMDNSLNLDNYRIKLTNHDIDDEYFSCNYCYKYIVTKASDFDTLWELYEDEKLWDNEISIESDIDLSSYTPTRALLPFDNYTEMTIDGHGHTISNFKGNYPFASDYCAYGNQTIKNLTIDNFDIALTLSDGRCDTKEGENDDVYVLIMGDNNDISNCNFTGKVAIEGEEGKNYIPCLGYEHLNLSNTTVSINGKVEISTGIAEVEADGSIYVRGREIIATEDVRIYNLMGEDVTRLNGMLSKGVYIVKGSKATKVVVR